MNNTLEHFLVLSKQELETLRKLCVKHLPPFGQQDSYIVFSKTEEELLTLIFEHGTNEQ
jgi:hypothetical protein